MKFFKYFLIFIINLSCKDSSTKLQLDKPDNAIPISSSDTKSILKNHSHAITTDTINKIQNEKLNIPTVSRHELVRFAKTLIGIPYKYASTDPSKGFDCSGFITYVFNHFHWEVPRSSVDFTNVGKQINLIDAKQGDLILFTGTNDSIKIVGHMGIITENIDTLRFIHSTSGRANGVTISNLEEHYKKRFVKVIRIFSD
ncbi:MAG: C40 family peptidase [Ginsengibacter sp.]